MADKAPEKKTPRKASPEIRAMNRIEAILEELDPNTAERVARYAYEKARQRDNERLKAETGNMMMNESPMRHIPLKSNVHVG